VLGPKPRELAHLDRLRGRRVDAAFARDVAELVHAQCKPLPNVPWDPEHRRELHRVLVRRAIEGWASESANEEPT
jgi:CO/xanthine dehydrogenase FAD-binding subunit